MTDQELSEIETRHQERKEFRDHIPAGPYFYDSLGYVHNELALRKDPTAKLQGVGLLVRSDEWFRPLNMDERLTRADHAVAPELGQYVARVCDHNVEDDMGALLVELRRLRAGKG